MKQLEIIDLPTDPNNLLRVIRRPLLSYFNRYRAHPYKMTALKELMKFMYNTCIAFEKEALALEAKQAPKTAKAKPKSTKETK